MDDAVTVFWTYLLLCLLMLLPLYAARHLIPGPTRIAERLVRRTGRFAYHHVWEVQKNRRGILFALGVHLPLICAIVMFAIGIVTATWQAILAACTLATLAILARRGLASLNRLRSRRSLPSWRR